MMPNDFGGDAGRPEDEPFTLTFAYGSNMCRGWLLSRVPGARYAGAACLIEYQLRFNKRSVDESGKGNAWETRDPNDIVWGVMVRVPITEKPALDRAEGLGNGYIERQVRVIDEGGAAHSLPAYVATESHIDHSLRPYRWYLDLVIRGAKVHGIPSEYVQSLSETVVIDDPNDARRSKARVACT